MRHMRHRRRHDRKLRRNQVGKFQVGMPRQRADRDRVAPKLDEGQTGNAHEIDNDRGPGHPEIQKRHQRLPPGHDLAVAVVAEIQRLHV